MEKSLSCCVLNLRGLNIESTEEDVFRQIGPYIKIGDVWYTSVILVMQEAGAGRLQFEADLGNE